MDSTAAEDHARKAKRTTSSGAGDIDLISGLDDDVLLRILELVGDTRDALRTCVLSRRWLGLWKRIPKLRFASCWPAAACSNAERHAAMKQQYVSYVNDILASSEPEYYVSSVNEVLDLLTHSPAVAMAADIATDRCNALELSALQQFVSCVNDILARRAQSDCAMESLVISYTTGPDSFFHKPHKQVTSAFVDAAQGWIQYAFRRHGLKSFVMDLHGLKRYLVDVGVTLKLKEEEEEETCPAPVVVLDELPNPPPLGMVTMHLALGGASVRLPANSMKFASLVDLSLEKMMITNGSARLLAYLVSPANCPRLQKLRMNQLRLPNDDGYSSDEEMKLESSMLSELWIDHVNFWTSLELTSPGLRIFHIDHCPMEKLTVSAPRLEEVAFFRLGYPPRCLEVVDGELPCVRSLKICLRAYRSSYRYCTLAPILAAANEINVRLLGQCISLTSLDVTLKGQQTSKTNVDIIKSKVPQLPQITSLTVNVSGDVFHRANFGTGVASILTRFSNLRNLSLHLPHNLCNMQVSDTTYPDHWISMAHLKRVELTGLSATELWFAKAVLESAKKLCMMTISFTAACWKQKHQMAAYKQMLHDEGMTTSHNGEFTLTCHKQSTNA